MSDFDFRIRYWGTTGTFARPPRPEELLDKLSGAIQQLCQQDDLLPLAALPPDKLRQRLAEVLPFWMRSSYGGNTSCIEIETPDGLIILDSGSGLREFGIELTRRWNDPAWKGARFAHVLLTHAHMDHTFGTPFFDPYYDAHNRFLVVGPKSAIDSLDTVLSPKSPLRSIYFPITFESLRAIGELKVIESGEEFSIGETHVSTLSLNHPGGCLAYRLQRGERTVVFASDHEHREIPDRQIVEFARGADLLYADAQYLSEEYDGRVGICGGPGVRRQGWGHSTVAAAVATGVAAGVKHLHLGHHEPKRSDQQLAKIEQLAQQMVGDLLREKGRAIDTCATCLAFEGLEIEF